MAARAFDALVIGTGQAGPALAVRLAQAGRKVCIFERAAFGGTCVNNGCTPTKTMVASAYAAHMARRAGEYGVLVPEVRVDLAKVRARKDDVVAKSSGGLEKWLRSTDGVTVVREHARFDDARTVRANGESYTAPLIYIDVGGRSAKPDTDAAYLTSETVMDVLELPGHLLVVGGSYIGLEFAQVFRRLGSRVTVIEKMPRLIAREDRDVSRGVKQVLEKEGIEIRVEANCISARRHAEGVEVKMDCHEGAPSVVGTHVLFATGRVPNTDDLGLDKAGIKKDERGFIVVNDKLETSVPGVYALGDCNGRGAFTHTAYNDYEIVADNLLSGASRKVTDRIPIYALFTDPPLGRVGMTVEQAKKGGAELLVGKMPMSRVSRAIERGETQGFMKVIVDKASRRILGAAILGASGDEVVQSLLEAIRQGMTAEQVTHGVRIHPTVAELLPTILGELRPLGDADE